MGAGVGRALRAALVLLELPELDEVAVLDVERVHEQDRVDGHVADDLGRVRARVRARVRVGVRVRVRVRVRIKVRVRVRIRVRARLTLNPRTGFVPLAWRTPFCAAFGLLFPIIVSWQRGAQLSHSDQGSDRLQRRLSR